MSYEIRKLLIAKMNCTASSVRRLSPAVFISLVVPPHLHKVKLFSTYSHVAGHANILSPVAHFTRKSPCSSLWKLMSWRRTERNELLGLDVIIQFKNISLKNSRHALKHIICIVVRHRISMHTWLQGWCEITHHPHTHLCNAELLYCLSPHYNFMLDHLYRSDP